MLIDLEPLLGMIYGWQYLHFYTHNFIGALLIGGAATLLGKPISEWVLKFLIILRGKFPGKLLHSVHLSEVLVTFFWML